MSKAARIFLGGIPTESDVRALIDLYGIPAEGTLIPYADVEELLRCDYRSHRFSTVTGRWRRQLKKDHNVATGTEGKAFKVLSPDERVTRGKDRTRIALRGIRRSVELVETTDKERLSPEMRAEADHLTRCAGALLLAARVEAGKVKPQLE
jgi:hypothetical protein